MILCMHLLSSLQMIRLTGRMAITPATLKTSLERTADRGECPDGSIGGHAHQTF